jgi:GNAT superfamily N-acetyltransferase
MNVREARPSDRDAVVAFTRDTWPDREGSDYVPDVFEEWIDDGSGDRRTFVLEADDAVEQVLPDGATVSHRVAGLCQGALLTDEEAWAQGMRVNPAVRGREGALELTDALLDWAAGRGATVCRNMVFSWNAAGLGLSRAAGFAPAAEFRWAHPDPDAGARPDREVVGDPAAAWRYWQDSPARDHLRGLGLDPDEPWALSEVTRERFERAADGAAVLAVRGAEGVRAATYRTRTHDRTAESGTETWAEYGVGAWAGAESARSLFAAVARDAAAVGADRTRVLVPETPRHVSDVARVRTEFSDDPDFVLAADLTGR